MKSLLERFEAKYIPEPNSGCWLWFGAAGRDGRGHLARSRPARGIEIASRVSWNLFRSKIPAGMDVLHTCDMPCCVNPDHLWLGNHKQNMHDCIRKGRFVNPPGFRGSACGASKLTEEQILEIRTRKLKNKEYAAKFGVRADHISEIHAGRVWGHLPIVKKAPRTEAQIANSLYCREWRRRKKLLSSE